MDGIINKIDEVGKPAWIGLMVLSFILFWPAGLALLAFLIWSGRMGHRHKLRRACAGRWRHEAADASAENSQGWSSKAKATSGNLAFDEYREETMQRLEREQREFYQFMERLRFAKDKQEFDQFLNERRTATGAFDATQATEAETVDVKVTPPAPDTPEARP